MARAMSVQTVHSILLLLIAFVLPFAAASRADAGRGPADSLARAYAEGHLAARRDGAGNLDRGPLHLVAEVRVEGSASFDSDRLGLAAFSGRPASAATFRALEERIRAHLLDNGHPFAEADLDFAVRREAPLVDLRIVLRAGPGYKYGGTRQGGSRTRPAVLERLMLLRYGEDYSESRLRLAAARLARTGYFEAVVPGPVFRDSTRNLLYPSLSLTDLKGNRLGGILGYDSEKDGGSSGGLSGFLDIHLINMRGTARDLDFTFESRPSGDGRLERMARFAFTEPWILGTALGARAGLDISLQDSVYEEGNAELTVFRDMGFHSRTSVHAAWQSNRDYLADRRSTAYSTGLGLVYDARDQVPGTLRGLRMEAKASGLRRQERGGSDSAYYLLRTHQQIGLWANRGRWVAHVSLQGGGVWPLDARTDRGDLFPLGGANTLRGYREKEFLTNLYLYGNLEMQFLLAPWSRASVFAVPGLVNRPGGGIHWRRVAGYGLGLEAGGKEWTFGVSYALNPDRSPGDGYIHLRVANNF